MPDLAPLREYERVLLITEAAATAEATRRYQQLRQRLLDSLLRSGSRALLLDIAPAFSQARQQLRETFASVARTTNADAAQFAREELAQLGRLLDRTLPAASAVGASADARARLDTALVSEALAWLDGVQGVLLAEVVRLDLAAADPLLVQQRLFAESIVVGERASVWRGGLAPLELALVNLVWGGSNGSRQLIYRQAEEAGEIEYRRQAIAAIDKRTTNCCLRVHGQIVAMDEPFTLTGTPRYGSKLMWPPFHYRCRTSIVLYHEAMERIGTPTPAMRAAARREEATRGGD